MRVLVISVEMHNLRQLRQAQLLPSQPFRQILPGGFVQNSSPAAAAHESQSSVVEGYQATSEY